ncbi:MAG: hypothetical protein ACOVO1_04615 [Chitinophagaceae bacterium]
MSAIKTILMLVIISCFIASCSTTLPSHYPEKYYKQNEPAIISIESNYSNIYKQKPLVIAFTDNAFQYVTLEMKTDSMRYVYEFKVTEKRLADTLQKFGFDVNAVLKLIKDMQRIKCTWINRLEYYVDDKKQNLIFLSIRPKAFDVLFSGKKYYTLTFYSQPQYYDSEGRLLDKRNRKRLRKINNEVFWRINSKVCYTVSDRFR